MHEALETFIESFKPVPMNKAFFLKIYGYELTWPGSAERCLQRLEELGSNRSRSYYAAIVAGYEEEQEKTTQEVAAWYADQLERQWKNEEVKMWKQTEQSRLEQIVLRERELELLKELNSLEEK